MGPPPLISDDRPAPVPDLLRLLPAGERQVLALVRSQRVTYREAAALLGISEDLARRSIRSGLQRLRAELIGIGPATA